MKHLTIIAFAAICVLFACTKDSLQTDQAFENLPVGDRGDKVTICHKTGNGSYHAITISVNALPAHLAHGDYLPDADGDGYTALGACTGSMDDCDDNDASVHFPQQYYVDGDGDGYGSTVTAMLCSSTAPTGYSNNNTDCDDTNADVHPGATEVCGNGIDDNCNGATDEDCCPPCPAYTPFDLETLNSMAPFALYYDSDVSICLPALGAAIFFPDGGAVVAFEPLFGGPKIVGVLAPDGCTCFYVVGLDITEEQYDADLATLRAAIAANPGAPNYCDLFPLAPSGDGVSALAHKESFLKMLPAKLREQLDNK